MMKKFTILLCMMAFAISIEIQFSFLQAQNPSTYDPNSGATIYHRSDGGTTIYSSRHDRVTTKDRNGATTSYDCKTDQAGCKEELEEAAGAETPDTPEGGEQTQSLPTEQTSFFDLVFSEYKAFSKGKNAKMYFRTNQGKWSTVQDWQKLHQTNLRNLK